MASDFKCSVTSARDRGSVHIEQLSCAELPSGSSKAEVRTVEVVRVTFPPEKLNLIDINAKRRFLVAKYHDDKTKILAELRGIFGNTDGGTATEALAMPDFKDIVAISGGIYFASPTRNWPQTGEKTRQGDGFVWYKPESNKKGYVLSEQMGNFTSGGYLLFDFQGHDSLVRSRQSPHLAADSLAGYRLIVQSNIVLVANGSEDGNADQDRYAVAALSAQKDGKLSLVVAAEPGKSSVGSGLTYNEFGNLLVRWGGKNAINLDGGPSAQIAVRKENCQDTQNPQKCIANLIHHTDNTNRMPQLFAVLK